MKKAQVAMEYLMTYGWVIVAILGVISALAYFHVLSPKDLLTGHTIFQSPVQNIDDATFSFNHNSIEIAFQNNKGISIMIPRTGTFNSSQCAAGSIISIKETKTGIEIDSTNVISNGDRFLITWTCTPNPGTKVGDRLKADVAFDYKNAETGQILKQIGSIEGKWS